MKKLCIYLFLVLFSLQTPSWADDIRDFEIEEMSIGDSALDYFSEEAIKNNMQLDYYKHIKNKKFYYETNFLCHFEFGYNKKSLRKDKIVKEDYSSMENSYEFYLKEWIFTYSFFLNENYKDDKMKDRILLIDYDDFIFKKNEYFKCIFFNISCGWW